MKAGKRFPVKLLTVS